MTPDQQNAPLAPRQSTRTILLRQTMPGLARRFRRDESGGAIIFTLYIALCMLVAVSMAIDIVRFEYLRAHMQYTLDRAVLAAADLDQQLEPTSVVQDFFNKAGLEDYLAEVDVDEGLNYRTVSASSEATLDTFLIDRFGIKLLSVPAAGTANETRGDVEIALVLDNSGSMGSNNNYRLNLLKPAAKEFVDAVVRPVSAEGTTSVSIVPFATQVNVGQDLLSYYNTTGEHNYSHCVTFSDSHFESTSLSRTNLLTQTAHFAPDSNTWRVTDNQSPCPTSSQRAILPWSTDADELKDMIEAMWAGGWTSIEIGAKWGLTLLDPSTRGILNAKIAKDEIDPELEDQPFDYTRDNSMKVLVVMSDGENTNQYDIKSGYRSGMSSIYHYQLSSGTNVYTYYKNRSGSNDWYWIWERDGSTKGSGWYDYQYESSKMEKLSWPEVWDHMGVERWAAIMDAAHGNGTNYWENKVTQRIYSSTKNPRTSDICAEAKNAGVIVFTIGMDTYGQGDATLADCASSDSHFFDVASLDISTAFASIARTINQLRLTN
ncbi:Flp pilus assembly protein TadG [Aliiruegeria haliotis]|uniref:Flp pilus assembly protein TadG n=1 Tax=Aliiruegeria haliotis TaxID=1280846 RepID=A0A2T0RW32_9RHOB|nr:TadE/TadG family type IV pilus assembly protein [Aliiruegeria haliotis]PRY25263.1 Flp pilus assembly protein TadG [Aliiruegeria haliotis]